jgi:hypothetical protein
MIIANLGRVCYCTLRQVGRILMLRVGKDSKGVLCHTAVSFRHRHTHTTGTSRSFPDRWTSLFFLGWQN